VNEEEFIQHRRVGSADRDLQGQRLRGGQTGTDPRLRFDWTPRPAARTERAAVTISGRRLLALDKAAEYLGIRPRTLEKLAHGGHMPYVKLGRATRYDIADLDAYVDRNRRRNRRAS
jgi:excisionase family DNA binding protein